MTTESLTAADLADRTEDERLRRADRKLLAETLRWARVNGYDRARDYDQGQFCGYSWVGPYRRVLFDPSGDTTIYVGHSMITAETAREAVDVLCALGVLPKDLSSIFDAGYGANGQDLSRAYRNGHNVGYRAGYGQGRDDEAAGADLPTWEQVSDAN